jgi:hypothetical protein
LTFRIKFFAVRSAATLVTYWSIYKNPLILSLLALALPSVSHAVKVADCPKAIDVKLSQIEVISAAQLKERLSPMENEDGVYESLRAKLGDTSRIEIAGKLANADKARCEYAVTKNSLGDTKGAELVLATSKGRDWIRVRVPTNDKDQIVGGYVTVKDYAPNAIVTEDTATLGADDFSHQGNLTYLGKAKSVDAR